MVTGCVLTPLQLQKLDQLIPYGATFTLHDLDASPQLLSMLPRGLCARYTSLVKYNVVLVVPILMAYHKLRGGCMTGCGQTKPSERTAIKNIVHKLVKGVIPMNPSLPGVSGKHLASMSRASRAKLDVCSPSDVELALISSHLAKKCDKSYIVNLWSEYEHMAMACGHK